MNKFQGSAKATMEYISAVKHYIRYMRAREPKFECKNLENITEYVIKSFSKNFMMGLSFNLNSPERMKHTRYPKKITGTCDNCGEISFLAFYQNQYCCPVCSCSAPSLDDQFLKINSMNNGIIAEGYFETDIICGNPVFEMIDPDKIDLEGLIMSIKYYREREKTQSRFFHEIIHRFNQSPQRFSFSMLCTIASDLIFF